MDGHILQLQLEDITFAVKTLNYKFSNNFINFLSISENFIKLIYLKINNLLFKKWRLEVFVICELMIIIE